MSKLLWIIFIALFLIMGWQGYQLNSRGGHSIICLEFASATEGKTIISDWNQIPYGKGTLANIAHNNTRLDFLFILTYVSLLISCSYSRMQAETSLFLNELLRWNLLLTILAGCFDCTENILLLYDFRHLHDPGLYISSYWVTLPKWILIGWVILVWLTSLLSSSIGLLFKKQ